MTKFKKNKPKKSKFRLLPLVIFFCVLMLSLRVGVLWRNVVLSDNDLYKTEQAFSVTAVQAQTIKHKDKQPITSKVAEAVDSERKGFGEDSLKEEEKSFSQSELEILQKLAKRREELDLREAKIDQKAGVLKAAEVQIDAKIAKLKEVEKSIQELVGVYDKKEKERMTNLVKIYSSMKPKEAARLFNGMEMELLVRLFEEIKEAKAAPILALMDSDKANALTAEIANKKSFKEYEKEFE